MHYERVISDDMFKVCSVCRREDTAEKRLQKSQFNDEIDVKYGFNRYKDPAEKIGWLINMHSVSRNVYPEYRKR